MIVTNNCTINASNLHDEENADRTIWLYNIGHIITGDQSFYVTNFHVNIF